MRAFFWIGLFSFPVFSITALAQMESLSSKDLLAAANLSAKEIREITAEVKKSAYDMPDPGALSYGCAGSISVTVPAS